MAERELNRIPPHMLEPIPASKIPELQNTQNDLTVTKQEVVDARHGYESLLAHLDYLRNLIYSISGLDYEPVNKTGDTMTGSLILGGGATVPEGQTLIVDGDTQINNISQVGGINTAGISTILASASEIELENTSLKTVISFIPPFNGNYLIYTYVRIKDISTSVFLNVNYIDGGGNQVCQIINGLEYEKGSYSIAPVFINSKANQSISITAHANHPSQVFISASIVGV